ncbi:MAG: nucleotide exchange factor GrpE [Acidimicrobiaceae bacterium]|nr:nucleotide exchange factor GrpE [Acidimicrobiaceae bacterium]MBT5580440.1 nucleotide exchange factor GrpE [Acidimicrobiaceae bacterium]MBT5849029.1 nucleotide exchange factor GrpE [Acidimicrobiaceae bacterium]
MSGTPSSGEASESEQEASAEIAADSSEVFATDICDDTVCDDTVGEGEPITVEDLLGTLERVTVERDQHLNDLQRVSAEFANFRKQTDKRNAEFAAQAGSRVAESLLPVLDACEAAAHQGVAGVEPIGVQLRTELERAGLQLIGDQSEPFDPNRHEAAISEPADDDSEGPVVAEVLRTGYAWNGRVLRAAMVKVKG